MMHKTQILLSVFPNHLAKTQNSTSSLHKQISDFKSHASCK